MSEIKFRAWDDEAEEMYYSQGGYELCTFVCESEGHLKCYVPEEIEATRDEDAHTVGRELFHIMQYTGLKDRNGKEDGTEIYKDDIISSFDGRLKYHVYWDSEYGQWWGHAINKTKGIYNRPLFEILNNNYMHVEGNVHQSPELLEKQ